MIVTFIKKQMVAHNTFSFWFKPLKNFEFLAGQFTQLHLPHQHMDDRGDKRWFTISSSPIDELVSITTKLFPDKQSSYKRTLSELAPGARLNFAEPMGDFVLPKDASIPLLFVAGGMGITPMHSIIKFLDDNHQARDIHLVYSVGIREELAWYDFFTSAKIRFTPIVNQPTGDWKDETGRLTSDRIMTWNSIKQHQFVYLAGPEIMVEQLVDELPNLGIDKSRLVTDYFPGYGDI